MKRNRERISLPNGNSCSQLSVHPANWETNKADISKEWYISYRFYSGNKSKQVIIKGMNHIHSLKARQELTKRLKKDELSTLVKDGYNPILQKYLTPPAKNNDGYKIHPDEPFSSALQLAFKYFRGVDGTKKDLKCSLGFLQKSIISLGYEEIPLSKIHRRHLLNILENCENIKKGFNNYQFNHYRTAFIMLYKVFERNEAVEASIVPKIEIRESVTQPRKEIPAEHRRAISDRLKKENYRFWRFINIFFSSGARLTEMSHVKGEHVNLRRQSVLYFVRKKKKSEWVERPIPDNAIALWKEALKDCKPHQYVFAKNLFPGDNPINSNQYTRRWRNWVKKPFKEGQNRYSRKEKLIRSAWMDYDLYDLKHTHTTLFTDSLFESALKEAETEAAKANGHTTTKMNKKVYDLHNKSRKDDCIKRANVKFA